MLRTARERRWLAGRPDNLLSLRPWGEEPEAAWSRPELFRHPQAAESEAVSFRRELFHPEPAELWAEGPPVSS
jgi:hypothetical protein